MSEEITKVWRRINLPGVIAGLLTIALPFLGMWWKFVLGREALIMAVSPFGVELSLFGERLSSPLFWWLCFGLKLCVMYIGVLLLLGSVLSVSERNATIAELLVQFSARKVLWLVVLFVTVLLVVIVLVNHLPATFGLPFQLQLSYLVGTSSVSAGLEGMRLTIPISMGFTQPGFVIAVLAAALGVVSRIYQQSFLKNEDMEIRT